MKSFSLVWVTLLAIVIVAHGHHHPDHHGDQVEESSAAIVPKNSDSRIQAAMESAEIVPDVVGKAPSQLIKVSGRGVPTTY